MAINLMDIQFENYEYVIESLEIKCMGLTHKIEKIQISNFYIERDYDNDHLPVILLQLVMSDELYHNICTEQDKAEFTILMKSQISYQDGTKVKGALYIKDKFVPKGVDGMPFTGKAVHDEIVRNTSGDSNTTLVQFSNVRTFILARQKDLVSTKKITNMILTKASMTDAIGVIMTEAGVEKLLMSPLQNAIFYNEVILLPQPTIAQLKYLNSFYGFYTEGAQIFFDLDCTYILRNSAKCTAYRKNEVQTVYFCIYDISTGRTASTGIKSYVKDKAAYVAVSSANMSVEDKSTATNDILGSNALVINTDGSVTEAKGGNGKSYNILSVTNHNPFYEREIQLRMMEQKCVVTLEVMNADLSLLTPNKTFKILYSDASVANKLKGSFRMCNIKTTFVKDGDKFFPSSIITLKRTEAE